MPQDRCDKKEHSMITCFDVHTDSDKPRFECEHCKRGFARADVLAKHVGRAHGSRRSGSSTPTPTRQLSEPEEPSAKRTRRDQNAVLDTLLDPSHDSVEPAQAQWVQLRDIQSHGTSRVPPASNIIRTSGFGNISTPSSNIDFSNASYNVDGLFSLDALASAASGPSGSSGGTLNKNLPTAAPLPEYELPSIASQGTEENISPAGTADSNFEHTFAWLFGNTTDTSSFAPPVDNFASILFAQPNNEPAHNWHMSGFDSTNNNNNLSSHVPPVFHAVSHQPAQPVAGTSALKPAIQPASSSAEPAVVYPIDSRSTVSFVNGNTLDEPKPLIDNARRAEMLNILSNSADREAFDQCFTCKKLNSMVELYFIGFDPFYPVLHRPTMPYRQSSPFLLLAVVFLGTAWAQDKDAFNLASRLHRTVRQSIFAVSYLPYVQLHGII